MPHQQYSRRSTSTRIHSFAAVLVLSLAGLPTASAHAASHYLTLINDDARTVHVVEVAPAGTSAWAPLDLGGPLIGGSAGQATVRFGVGRPCKEDLRIIFAEKASLVVTDLDVCRVSTLHLGRARATALTFNAQPRGVKTEWLDRRRDRSGAARSAFAAVAVARRSPRASDRRSAGGRWPRRWRAVR